MTSDRLNNVHKALVQHEFKVLQVLVWCLCDGLSVDGTQAAVYTLHTGAVWPRLWVGESITTRLCSWDTPLHTSRLEPDYMHLFSIPGCLQVLLSKKVCCMGPHLPSGWPLVLKTWKCQGI